MKLRTLGFTATMILLCATAVFAQTNSSVYTDLDGPKCRTIESTTEGAGYYKGQCPGIAGYKLIVEEGDIRQNLTVITPAEKKFDLNLWGVVGSSFSNLGSKAEWRVAGKSLKPNALIVRFNVADPEGVGKGTSWLVAIKITATDICVTDKIAPGADQNVKAREAADASSGKPCLQTGN
jgi:hypothetical protein